MSATLLWYCDEQDCKTRLEVSFEDPSVFKTPKDWRVFKGNEGEWRHACPLHDDGRSALDQPQAAEGEGISR